MIVCGDFYQLLSVNGAPIYSVHTTMKGLVTSKLWKLFEMAEPKEVMRQRVDLHFTGILHKIPTGYIGEDVNKVPRSRFISNNNQTILVETVHIYAENEPVDIHKQPSLPL